MPSPRRRQQEKGYCRQVSRSPSAPRSRRSSRRPAARSPPMAAAPAPAGPEAAPLPLPAPADGGAVTGPRQSRGCGAGTAGGEEPLPALPDTGESRQRRHGSCAVSRTVLSTLNRRSLMTASLPSYKYLGSGQRGVPSAKRAESAAAD